MKCGVVWYLWGIVGAERAAMPHIKYRYKGTIFRNMQVFYQKNSIKTLMYSTAGSYYIPTFLH